MSRKQCSKWSQVPLHTLSPSHFPNIRISRGRDSYDSMCCLAQNMHFMLSGLCKMGLGWGREINVERGLRGHRLFSFRLSQNSTSARSRKRWFMRFRGTIYAFYTFWPIQNATCVRSRKKCSTCSPDLSYTFSHSGSPKIRLFRRRKFDDSGFCVALNGHSMLPGLFKMQLGRIRESNVPSGRRVFHSYFRLPAVTKYISDVEKAMIEWVAWH